MNLYRQLIDLLPTDPLTVGVVLAAHADSTVTVEYPGGGQQRIRGVATVGNTVFIQSGQVQGIAPSLDFVTIDV